ncbi:hypothetical protein FQR65_LT09619 [Abscondita terminalis]|nr:hypothetical protein FQR65_LT09619 [Abscondita terminalis]
MSMKNEDEYAYKKHIGYDIVYSSDSDGKSDFDELYREYKPPAINTENIPKTKIEPFTTVVTKIKLRPKDKLFKPNPQNVKPSSSVNVKSLQTKKPRENGSKEWEEFYKPNGDKLTLMDYCPVLNQKSSKHSTEKDKNNNSQNCNLRSSLQKKSQYQSLVNLSECTKKNKGSICINNSKNANIQNKTGNRSKSLQDNSVVRSPSTIEKTKGKKSKNMVVFEEIPRLSHKSKSNSLSSLLKCKKNSKAENLQFKTVKASTPTKTVHERNLEKNMKTEYSEKYKKNINGDTNSGQNAKIQTKGNKNAKENAKKKISANENFEKLNVYAYRVHTAFRNYEDDSSSDDSKSDFDEFYKDNKPPTAELDDLDVIKIDAFAYVLSKTKIRKKLYEQSSSKNKVAKPANDTKSVKKSFKKPQVRKNDSTTKEIRKQNGQNIKLSLNSQPNTTKSQPQTKPIPAVPIQVYSYSEALKLSRPSPSLRHEEVNIQSEIKNIKKKRKRKKKDKKETISSVSITKQQNLPSSKQDIFVVSNNAVANRSLSLTKKFDCHILNSVNDGCENSTDRVNMNYAKQLSSNKQNFIFNYEIKKKISAVPENDHSNNSIILKTNFKERKNFDNLSYSEVITQKHNNGSPPRKLEFYVKEQTKKNKKAIQNESDENIRRSLKIYTNQSYDEERRGVYSSENFVRDVPKKQFVENVGLDFDNKLISSNKSHGRHPDLPLNLGSNIRIKHSNKTNVDDELDRKWTVHKSNECIQFTCRDSGLRITEFDESKTSISNNINIYNNIIFDSSQNSPDCVNSVQNKSDALETISDSYIKRNSNNVGENNIGNPVNKFKNTKAMHFKEENGRYIKEITYFDPHNRFFSVDDIKSIEINFRYDFLELISRTVAFPFLCILAHILC